MTSKEMPIEKVRKMLQLDWEAMKKLGHSEDDLDMLESEITDAITAHLCPGDFLPGKHHEDRDCPNDCAACWGGYVELVNWGGYVELVKTTRELEKRFDEMQEDAR